MIMYIRRYVALFATTTMLLWLAGCCDHVWTDATCVSPKTCTECGVTQGDVVHQWTAATCTTPITCTLCGETDGDVVHNYEVITCLDPTVCSNCGVMGEVVGHVWSSAACDERRVCGVCLEKEDQAIGHSTRYGDCTRCGEFINCVEYIDGFAMVTYSDTQWMQEKDGFTDVYVNGIIMEISKTNDFVIVDSEGGAWTADVGTGRDFSSYVGTMCEVYGFSTGGISSQHDTPLINMNHDDNRVVFEDGKELYPEIFETEQQFSQKQMDGAVAAGSVKVWIPTNGGAKFHSKSSCSSMDNARQVTMTEAINAGFSRCGRCW